jgi:hypothetical protein
MTRRRSFPLIVLFALLTLSGCRSAFVEITLRNSGNSSLHLIEVDYPSASFGTQTLTAQSEYHYHFKIQGTGPITLSFADDTGKTHSSTGPTLREGQQGHLTASITSAYNVDWSERLIEQK